MLTNTLPVILTRFNMVDTLIQIRQEWEQAAEGKSLVDVQGSVGLLLADVVAALGLGASDQVLVLGPALHANLQDILVGPENGKGS